MNKLIKNQKGTTLLELVVAVAIFSVIVLSATAIFRWVIEGQRNAITSQNVQESMRYALEVISKEIKHAQKADSGNCPTGVPGGKIFQSTSSDTILDFKNKNDKCVTYSVDSGTNRFKIKRTDLGGGNAIEDYITPNDIKVSNLKFVVVPDNSQSQGQAKVTLRMDIEANIGKSEHKQKMTIQTTISSMYYD